MQPSPIGPSGLFSSFRSMFWLSSSNLKKGKTRARLPFFSCDWESCLACEIPRFPLFLRPMNETAVVGLPLEAKRGFRMPRLQEAGLIIVVVILGTILSAYGHHDARPGQPNTFLRVDNLIDGIATPMAVYAIMAVGETGVIITGGIDISVASMFVLSALAIAGVLQHMDPDAPAWKVLPVAFLIGPGVGLVCGLLNGILVTTLRMHPFIVTLGTLSIFRGIANVCTTEKTLPLQSKGLTLPDSFTTDFFQRYFFQNADGTGGVQILPMIVMLAVLLLGWFYLRLMVAGREQYAVGGNEEAARFSGLRVNWIKLRVYGLCGLMAGVAALVTLGYRGAISTNSGQGYELTVIAAAVVGGSSLTGGRGTALGALLGALVIRLIEDGILILHMNQEYSQIIIGSAIIIAVAVDRLSEFFRNRRMAQGRG